MVSLANVLEKTQAKGTAKRNFALAGITISLIGEPEWLEPISEAFAHLPVSGLSPDLPDLTVHVRGKLPTLEGVNPDRVHWLNQTDPHAKQLLEPHTNVALYQQPTPLLTHQQCAPLLHILNAFLEQRQIIVLHAAAIATSFGAALLVGRGGSGKSTTALMSLKAGLQYLADDYCAFGFKPEPTVYSLFSSAKFHFKDASQFSFLTARSNPDLDKAFTMLEPQFATQLVVNSPIRTVLLPTLGTQLGFEAVSPQTALLALAPSTLLQLKTKQHALKQMSALVRTVPSYRLFLGDNPSLVPNAIRRLLETL